MEDKEEKVEKKKFKIELVKQASELSPKKEKTKLK
jgi:hypothetical protein